MTLQLQHPLNIQTLADLVRADERIALDWLQDQDQGVGSAWLNAPLAQRKFDLLMLYARDVVAVPCDGKEWESRGCLFPANFTESLLAAWLEVVGDERAKYIPEKPTLEDYAEAAQRVGSPEAVRLAFAILRGDQQNAVVSPNLYERVESASRLETKRRVLGMFGELERVGMEKVRGTLLPCVLRPIDLLPLQTVNRYRPWDSQDPLRHR